MSNGGKTFDKDFNPMPDFTLKVDEDLESCALDNTEPNEEEIEELIVDDIPKREVDDIFLSKRKRKEKNEKILSAGVSQDKENPGIKQIIEEIPKPKKMHGERGKDRKPRKKRVMTDKQREALAKGRERSLAIRRAKAAEKKKKAEDAKKERSRARQEAYAQKKANKKLVQDDLIERNTPISKPIPIKSKETKKTPTNVFNDFDQFCGFMDRYEDYKRKKHSTNRQPHPNKKINYQDRPRAPVRREPRTIQQQRHPTPGGRRIKKEPLPTDFSPYALLKSGRTSVFQGGMGGNKFQRW